jgi:HAD superfamily hydrolase (TIGR01549 family)
VRYTRMPLYSVATPLRRAIALASAGTAAAAATTAALSLTAASCAGVPSPTPHVASNAEVTDRFSSASRGQELLGECNERLTRLVAHFAGSSTSGSSSSGSSSAVVKAQPAASPAFEIGKVGFKRKVRLVTFDLDDTLWDTWSVLTQAHRVKQSYMEDHYPRITDRWDLAATRQHNTDVRNSRPDLAHSFTASHREAIRLQAAAVGYDEAAAVEDIYGAFALARNDVTLYDDALHMLTSLKRAGLLIGTITNGNADATKVPGLSDVIDFAVDAHQAGAAKPKPAVFHLALTQAAEVGDGTVIDPEEVVHVGDDLTSDVLGAQRVGFRTIHFFPESRRAKARAAAAAAASGDQQGGGRMTQQAEPPDATVATLSAIVNVIDVWNGPS